MTTTATPLGHVVALIGTDVRFYDVEHDPDLEAALLEVGDRFYRRHILARVPPPVDGSEGSARMIRQLFARSKVGVVQAPAEAAQLVEQYIEAAARAKEAEKAKDAAQARLCALIGDAQGIESAEFLATWKEREGSPDYKALAEKLGATPDLVEQYRRDPYRALRVVLKNGKAA
jgi:predicted phage-related endonuclease